MIILILDLTGQKYGLLTAIKKLDKKNIHNSYYWLCKCECGNLKEVPRSYLVDGTAKSCGCLKYNDITGQKFGLLTALKRLDRKTGRTYYWLCKCECGNLKEVPRNHLKDGGVRSCGCLKHDNLIGQKFGRLTVIKKSDRSNKAKIYWSCQCECGNIKEVRPDALKSGATKSCGCISKEKSEDLTGKKYGLWTVLEKLTGDEYNKWLCICECGAKKPVSTRALTKGLSKSCGCVQKRYADMLGKRYGNLTVIEKVIKADYHKSSLWKCLCDCGNTVVFTRKRLMGGEISCGCKRMERLKESRKENLIEGTSISSITSKKLSKRNTTGVKGVSKCKNLGYTATIHFKGKYYYLGFFKTIEEAAVERKNAEDMLHGPFLEWYYQKYPQKKRHDSAIQVDEN